MNSSNFKKSIAVFALVLFSGVLLGTGNTKVEAASVSAISSLQQTAADKKMCIRDRWIIVVGRNLPCG